MLVLLPAAMRVSDAMETGTVQVRAASQSHPEMGTTFVDFKLPDV